MAYKSDTEPGNAMKEQPIILADILQEQKTGKYSGGIYHKTQINFFRQLNDELKVKREYKKD